MRRLEPADRQQLATLRERLGRLGAAEAEAHDVDFALALLDTARVIVVVLDARGRIVFVNRYLERLTGRAASEVEGQDWLETLIPPEDRPDIGRRFAAAVGGDATVANVNPILVRDGGRRVIEWYDRTLRGSDGDVVALLAIGHDVTEKLEALAEARALSAALESRVEQRSRELAASHAILEGIFHAGPQLVAFLDTDLRFVRVNRAYAAADGKTPEDFPGVRHFDLYPHAENEVLFRRVLATGEPHRVEAKPFEYAHAPERGVTHWDWTLTPVKAEDGAVTGVVLALSDVTARVRAIEAAQESEAHLTRALAAKEQAVTDARRAMAQREAMIAELDHRVKNTLASVAAIAEQTLARAHTLEAFRETFLGRVRSLARTHEALAASRWAGVSLSQVVRTVLEPLSGAPLRLEEGSVDLELRPAVVTPLSLALHELATNAVKHGALASIEGRVRVRSRLEAGRLVLDWTEHAAAGGSAPRPTGTGARDGAAGGLGLVLVRGLIERELGGTLDLEARSEGRRYVITLAPEEGWR